MFSAVKLQVFNPVLKSNCNHGIAGKFESRRPLSLRLPDHRFASLSSSEQSVSSQFTASVGSSSPSLQLSHWNLTQRHILTLNFVACAVAVSATWLFFSAIPTLLAFKRAAESLEKLLDVRREELPDTMATFRLSGMEISDLTMELSDLGQEITQDSLMKLYAIEARANSRTESPKIRNRQRRKKFNGTPTRPRLSVFCSDKQLYVALVDDQNKKNIFYGSTLQETVREEACSTVQEAAALIGEDLVKTCTDLNINEMSYDRNGFARGSKMQAFEIAISRHGLLS